jgi:hypothetical protein
MPRVDFLKLSRLFLFLSFCCFYTFCVFAQEPKTELVLKAKMVSVEAFNPDEIVDALDAASAEGVLPSATVVFKVAGVVKGNLPLPKPPPSSGLWAQTQDAYKEKNFLKMITMDS